MSDDAQAAREEAALAVLRKHFSRESDDMHEVAPRLWVGSRAAARNTAGLAERNITHGAARGGGGGFGHSDCARKYAEHGEHAQCCR